VIERIGPARAPERRPGVFIFDSDALSKLAQLEGDAWLDSDERMWRQYRGKETAHAAIDAWNYGHGPEVPPDDWKYWRDVSDSFGGVIYGAGGYARFAVANDGEIRLDPGSTRPEKVQRAVELGFRVPTVARSNPMPSLTGGYFYHWTHTDALPSIAAHGLRQGREGLWVSESPTAWSEFAWAVHRKVTLLRFPRDTVRSAMVEKTGMMNTLVVHQSVPAAVVEILDSGSWRGLRVPTVVRSNPMPDDWSAVPQADLVEIVRYEGEGWTEEIPDPSTLTWRFAWIPTSELVGVMPGGLEGWRSWWAEEAKHEAGGRGVGYTRAIEAAWLKDPLALGPILVARYADGHVDIGDGWHRAAVSVLHGVPRVPVIIADVPYRSPIARAHSQRLVRQAEAPKGFRGSVVKGARLPRHRRALR